MEWERGMGRIFPGGASSPALKVFFFLSVSINLKNRSLVKMLDRPYSISVG